MNKPCECGAEARPISHESVEGRHILEQIVIASDHADGCGSVHLTVDQALYIQSRLSQIAVTFLPHHQCNGLHPHHQATAHPDGPPAHDLGTCGAEAWPIACEGAGLLADLEKVVVESDRPDGCGPIHLSPEQVLCIEERLTHMALAFLHDKGWGGEDARNQ